MSDIPEIKLPELPRDSAALDSLSRRHTAVLDELQQMRIRRAEVVRLNEEAKDEIRRLKGELEAAQNGLRYWDGIAKENVNLRAKVKELEGVISADGSNEPVIGRWENMDSIIARMHLRADKIIDTLISNGVDRWHNGIVADVDVSFWLGITKDQYARYVEGRSLLEEKK